MCLADAARPGFTGGVRPAFTAFVRDELEADQPQQLILPGADPKADLPLPRRLMGYLQDRGPKRLRQLKGAFPKQPVELTLEQLESAGMVASEAILAPPSARAKTIKRLYPSYAQEDIAEVAGRLGKSVKHADLLALIAERDEDAIGVDDALRALGARNRAPLNRLVNEGLVFIEETDRGEQDLIILEATSERVETALGIWRGTTVYAQIMREIAEMLEPPTMSESAAVNRRDAVDAQQVGQGWRPRIARRTGLARLAARL